MSDQAALLSFWAVGDDFHLKETRVHALWLLQCWRVCPVDVIFGGGSVSVLEVSEKPVATWAWVPALSSAYSSRCAG